MVRPFSDTGKANRSGQSPLTLWSSTLSSSLATLRRLAGATEHEFLQIGAQMQEIYSQSLTLSQTAHRLVEVASGERLQALIDRLREILDEMNNYLGRAQTQSVNSYTTLHSVGELLKTVGEPLSGVRNMCKHLYILEVSIKIESSHLGDMGSEFINLAMDIKKLSQQIKEKVNSIQDHRKQLGGVIIKNSTNLENAKKNQDTKAESTLSNTVMSLTQLETANAQFFQLGSMISAISRDNSDNISTIVQSMQFHDIYRQQVEHVIEGLEGLLPLFAVDRPETSAEQDAIHETVIGKTGDVCELQEAQLQFASLELYTAVTSIVDSLRSIGIKQKEMAQDIITQTGGRKNTRATGSSGTLFIAEVSRQMNAVTGLLATCAASNSEMAAIMREVTGTVRQITGYVSDIEEIGHDIIQIALNARIKAASTGNEGASLSVLAEEIGQMSSEAVERTDLITTTLNEIHGATDVLSTESQNNEENLSVRLANIEQELSSILAALDEMGEELISLLAGIAARVESLSADIETLSDSIDVHETTKAMADEVLEKLRSIFSEARRLYPASAAFKEDLRQMAQRYTMESERRIHETIANKHGVGPAPPTPQATTGNPADESEFGDNVDLF